MNQHTETRRAVLRAREASKNDPDAVASYDAWLRENPDLEGEDRFLTPQERKNYEGYAVAMGWSNVQDITDKRLKGLMDSIAEKCDEWGSD